MKKNCESAEFFVIFVINFHMRRKIFILSAIFLLAGAAAASSREASGDELYSLGRYSEAAEQYRLELNREPASPRLLVNLACSLYQIGKYDEALEHLQNALKFKPEPSHASRIHYNIGNCYFTANRLDEAIEAYKNALRVSPGDGSAKYNLEIALKRRDDNSPPPSGGSSSQNPDQNDSPPPPQSNHDSPQSESPKSQMSRDEAERILDALRQSEKGPTYKGKTQRNYFNTTIKRDW